MTLTALRRTVVGVCVAGIAGMIASSIADNTGAAITFGLVTAVAILCSIVATAVTGAASAADGDALAAEVEERVQALVEAGADEGDLRRLVAAAVRLGRAR